MRYTHLGSNARVPALAIALVWACLAADSPASAQEPAVSEACIVGQIKEAQFTFTATYAITTGLPNQSVTLITGDVALDQAPEPVAGRSLRYDPETKSYIVTFARPGEHELSLRFAARANPGEDPAWRDVRFTLPSAQLRPIAITADRDDLEVELPGAVRFERKAGDGQTSITALQGAQRGFELRWKPQVQELDAKLVLSSRSNVIADVRVGALRVDTLTVFDVAQGRLGELRFAVTPGLNITQVRGAYIRDWHLDDASERAGEGGGRELVVALNRPQTQRYALRVIGEMPLGAMPTAVDLPSVVPTIGLRAGGNLAIGTNSAIELVVERSIGLAQIDAAAMPRLAMDPQHPRNLPGAGGKAFFYSFAGGGYRVRLALDNIVPAYDVVGRNVLRVTAEDLILESQIELDVRDAPIRDVTVMVPAGLAITAASGAGVTDYRVLTPIEGRPGTPVRIEFQQPLLGRGLVALRMELGKSPLDATQSIAAPIVEGAANQRGYLVVVVEDGLQVEASRIDGLRTIAAASVPMRVPDVQFAYRYREPDWSIVLHTTQTPASIRMESFHLLSLGEGLAYGSVAANYFITGSPIDELRFIIAPELGNVQFVGRDVRRWRQDPQDPARWIVTLQRKVVGDYNLGITYTQRYSEEQPNVLIGGVAGEGVETQIGYVGIASHLNLKLTDEASDGDAETALLIIDREELPASYRLLINAPLLKTYKYVASPHSQTMRVDAYERGVLTPVVIELMEANTRVLPQEGAAVESVTTVRYKVKNASQQFLTLSIPVGADVWATRLVETTPQGEESTRRIAASLDRGTGRIMIPLERQRDPNRPITIELEYGQVHDALGWSGEAEFFAPIGDVPSTFDSWTLRVPDGWAITPVGGTMKPDARGIERTGVGPVMGGIGDAWGQAGSRLMRAPYVGVVVTLLVIAACVLGVVFVARREWFLDAVGVVVLLAAVCVGGFASTMPALDGSGPADTDASALRYTQVIDLATDEPLAVATRIVPAWRQHVTVFGLVIVPVAALVCLVAAIFWRKARPVLLAAGLTGLIYAASQFTGGVWLMGHALTWGLPLALLVALGWWIIARRGVSPAFARGAVATATFALMIGGLAGCNSTPPTSIDAGPNVLRDLELNLTVESDNVAGEAAFSFVAAEPTRFDLLPNSAIVLDTQSDGGALRVDHGDKGYQIVVTEPGRYEATVRFLLPLAPADENQVRAFKMPLPLAMSKRVALTIPHQEIEVRLPSAMNTTITHTDDQTHVVAGLGPVDSFVAYWRPRDRQRELEQTDFFTTITSAVRFDAGLADARHDLRFEIAQGQLDEIRAVVPGNMTVTEVTGDNVGAWRFDPTSHELEVKLSRPAIGEYRLAVAMQIATPDPGEPVAIETLRITDTARQRATIGLTTSGAVDITVVEHPPAINAADFDRDATEVLQSLVVTASGPEQGLSRHTTTTRFAYRLDEADARVVVDVLEVMPEIRANENATFTVADDRLVYVGEWNVQIAKAGVFSFQIEIPAGYDIDTLNAEDMSHWDERVEDGRRIATVHLPVKRLGPVPVYVALSRPISGLPAELDVPRVSIRDALKHTGRAVITADRGVRLTVDERQGVSELNPVDLGIREQGTLVFGLLRPKWSLSLNTEVVEPRIMVDALHVAEVSEGLVQHTHHLRYNLRHAGIKEFEVEVEPGALGLLITGPNIARREEAEPGSGRWRIELSGKWYDRPYPLTVRYETRFDRDDPLVVLRPVIAAGADLQTCYVVARSNERVELTAELIDPSLQVTEARAIPRTFAAGNLSDAALAYRAASADYTLSLRAQRLDAADLLDAEVLGTEVTSVVTERGEAINRVVMSLRVGSKRNLETRLPAGAEVWSLLVNGRAATPAIRRDRAGDPVYLIPLSQSASGDLPVDVDMVYVVPAGPTRQWGRPAFDGPRFDLPLRDLRWVFYVPEGYRYDDFAGTLAVNPDAATQPVVTDYNAQTYEQEVLRYQRSNLGKAAQFQVKGSELAGKGELRAAKQALENAYNYSLGDESLNEDARVQLNRLNRDQALVGLVESRNRLRQLAGPAQGVDALPQQAPQVEQGFDVAQADRIRTSLSRSDSENLELIIAQLIETQEAAAGTSVPLVVAMPLRGRVIEFRRAIQVEPNAAMTVTFNAKPPGVAGFGPTTSWVAGLFLALLLIFALGPHALQRLRQLSRPVSAGSEADAADDGFFDDDDESMA